jgi:hypothetical protein
VTSAGLAAVALFLWALQIGYRTRDWPLLAVPAAGLLVTAGTALAIPPTHLAALPHFGGRYAFVPWVCLVWACVLLLERGRRIAWAPISIVAALSAVQFPISSLDRHDWASDAQCLETHVRCDLEVNPEWHVGLPGRGHQLP